MAKWQIFLSPEAQKQLASIAADQQQVLLKTLRRMGDNPFAGDVTALQGREWKGCYRKRAGRWRLIFVPNLHQQTVEIALILLRSEKTYR